MKYLQLVKAIDSAMIPLPLMTELANHRLANPGDWNSVVTADGIQRADYFLSGQQFRNRWLRNWPTSGWLIAKTVAATLAR